MDMKEASALYRLLGDEARLRLLRVLARDHFNVKELTGILGLAQSGVSRHLGLLKDAGLVAEEREGAFTYYRLSPTLRADAGPLWPLLQTQFDEAAGSALLKADEARLQEVVRVRRENFDRHAGPDTRDGRQLVPGRSWAAWSRALGSAAARARRRRSRLRRGLPVDRGRAVGAQGDRRRSLGRRARPRPGARRCAATSRTSPGSAASSNGCRSTMPASTWCCCRRRCITPADPARAVAEAVRVLREGGRVLVLDLRSHDEGWVRDALGDRWQGFTDDHLQALLAGAGLTDVRVRVGARNQGDPFVVLLAVGTKPRRRRTRT